MMQDFKFAVRQLLKTPGFTTRSDIDARVSDRR